MKVTYKKVVEYTPEEKIILSKVTHEVSRHIKLLLEYGEKFRKAQEYHEREHNLIWFEYSKIKALLDVLDGAFEIRTIDIDNFAFNYIRGLSK